MNDQKNQNVSEETTEESAEEISLEEEELEDLAGGDHKTIWANGEKKRKEDAEKMAADKNQQPTKENGES